MKSSEIEFRLRQVRRASLVAFLLAACGAGLVFAFEGRSAVLAGLGGTMAVMGVFGGGVTVGVGILLTIRLWFGKVE